MAAAPPHVAVASPAHGVLQPVVLGPYAFAARRSVPAGQQQAAPHTHNQPARHSVSSSKRGDAGSATAAEAAAVAGHRRGVMGFKVCSSAAGGTHKGQVQVLLL